MRWLYPTSETNYNRENLIVALDRQYEGYDEINKIMWPLLNRDHIVKLNYFINSKIIKNMKTKRLLFLLITAAFTFSVYAAIPTRKVGGNSMIVLICRSYYW